jgi:NADH-quinone oxidoreductase subunit F/NAD(P)H dehydrogenase (quinone)/NADP-reducing hydrogenase subunit HndC
MARLNPKTLDELHRKVERFLEVRFVDEEIPGKPTYPYHLLICGGTGCHATKSLQVKARLEEEIEKRGLQDKVWVIETGCNGFCAQGPVMSVFPGGIFYQYLEGDDALEIIEEHVLKGNPVERLMYRDLSSGKVIPRMKDIPFFAFQKTLVLQNRGLIHAEKIEEYIGVGGYKAVSKALTEMTSEDIIAEVKESGLRGRGGAGFPTGIKWEFATRSSGPIKYVLCNADEGDPGAFMDRSVLEADPHAVLEGMVIAAKAIGSNQGYIYCRAEYPLAIKRLSLAIEQAKEMGLLGEDILGTGFDFEPEIYQGAGAFVCGEETALMTSIEGKRGMPRPRPPFPAHQGLWSKPTVLNNVETYANVPRIILNGGGWFASMGTEKSKGTKVFALTGAINNVGLVEVPMGMSLGGLIYDIGGGIHDQRNFKAAQMGGPSGGCIPAELIEIEIDYDSLAQAGAMMGSGGVVVIDDQTCMVDTARFFVSFTVDESCGKCTPCREGLQRMYAILDRICKGKGEEEDIERLHEMAATIKDASLCGLGQTAPNPVLTVLRYFQEEVETHIRDRRCPAGVCPDLIIYEIDPEKCKACGICRKKCPVDAIIGAPKQIHTVVQEKCIRCGTCYDVCPDKFHAVVKK